MSELKTSLVLSLRDSVIAPRSRPGSPGGARPDARRLPATGHGWRRRNGLATGLRPASASAPASSRRCCLAARRPRPAHRRSRLCPAEQPPGVLHQEQAIAQRESFDVSTGRQQRLLIEDRHTLEPRRFASLDFFEWPESIDSYYPGTEEAHTNPNCASEGSALRALAVRVGFVCAKDAKLSCRGNSSTVGVRNSCQTHRSATASNYASGSSKPGSKSVL